MDDHEVRVQRPGERFPRQRELAWRLAEVAGDPAPVAPEVAAMVGNRLLDDVATRVAAEWAAWANGTAVRELDFHDTFLAADFAHPGDNIPPLLAVAQQTHRSGADLVRAVVAAYEVEVALTRAIDLHSHKIDHVAHLGPSVAAGLGALLGLDTFAKARSAEYQAQAFIDLAVRLRERVGDTAPVEGGIF